MKIRVPDYYKNFKCIASACTDSCCAGWEVDLDDPAYDYYLSVKGPFGERLRSVMVDDKEGKRFRLNNNRCPFLNDTNLCDLYTELGEEKLCDTCTNYPRFIEEYGSLREIGIALSCKTAGELILGSPEPVTFELSENDEMVTSYNDIDPELYMQLVPSRKLAIRILQNRAYTIEQRIAVLLSFVSEMQNAIDEDALATITDIRKKYNFETEFSAEVLKASCYDPQTKLEQMKAFFKVYTNIEIINEAWPKTIQHLSEALHNQVTSKEYQAYYDAFDLSYKDRAYEFEHLMVYFMFRYFLKAVNDYDILSKVKMAVVSYFCIKEIDLMHFLDHDHTLTFTDQVDIMHLYSREIEHSYENFEELGSLFHQDPLFDTEKLFSMLNY